MKKIAGKWQFRFLAPNVKDNQKVALDKDGNPLVWEDDKDPKMRKKAAKQEPLTEEEWQEIERDFNFGRTLPKHSGHPKFTPIEEGDLPLLADDDWRKYPDSMEWGLGWIPVSTETPSVLASLLSTLAATMLSISLKPLISVSEAISDSALHPASIALATPTSAITKLILFIFIMFSSFLFIFTIIKIL